MVSDSISNPFNCRPGVFGLPYSDSNIGVISDHLSLKCVHLRLSDALFSCKKIETGVNFIRRSESAGMFAPLNRVLECPYIILNGCIMGIWHYHIPKPFRWVKIT